MMHGTTSNALTYWQTARIGRGFEWWICARMELQAQNIMNMSKKHNKFPEQNKAGFNSEKKESDAVETTETAECQDAEETKEAEKASAAPSESIEALQKEIGELKAAVAKEKDDYVRLMADFENFRRHSSEAKLELVKTAAADTIKGLLPVLDDCERAMKMLENSTDENARQGTELIYTKLMGYLKTKGLEPIKALGETFDTDLHEAVAQFPVAEEDKKGKVFDVVMTGYTLGGKIIRFAKVVVGI
jgi:Molecular chaperone GrpE (heat shock protein)